MTDDGWSVSRVGARLLRIASLSIEFESEWMRGENPSIGEYLERVPEELRGELRRELDGLIAELESEKPADASIHEQTIATEHATTWQPSSDTSMLKTEGSSDPRYELRPGERVGRYIIQEKIGRGGMGVVYRAIDPNVSRHVAVKVLRIDGLVDERLVAQFRTECRAIGQVVNENVVPIYDSGEVNGLHFVVMRYFACGTLADRLKKQDSSMAGPEAAHLLALVARAVDAFHSHDKPIIHRDIKPNNILLDEHGSPYVSDFGLAKFVGEEGLTRTGDHVGTDGYMAPEQLRDSKTVDPAADIYSLGATLYRMVAGRPPHQAASRRETQRQTLEDEPVPLRRLNPAISKDLETVCSKCLEKQPARRFATALALAEELERIERGEPIKTRPITSAERLVRWAARRPQLATMAGVAVAATIVSIVTLALLLIAGRESIRRLERDAYFSRVQLACEAIESGREERALELLEGCRQKDRDWEWSMLRSLCYKKPRALPNVGLSLLSVAFGPNHDSLVTAGRGGHIVVYGPDGPEALPTTHVQEEGSNFQEVVWLSSDDRGDSIFAGARDGSTVVWERRGGTWHEHRLARAHNDAILGVAADAAARVVLTSGTDRRVVAWRPAVDGWQHKVLFHLDQEVWAIALAPDGRTIAIATLDHKVLMGQVDDRTLHTVTTLSDTGQCLSFSRDGRLLAAGAADGTVMLLDLQSNASPLRLPGLPGDVVSLTFTPDGRRLVAGGAERLIRFWDTSDGREVMTLRGPDNVLRLRFSPEGRELAGAFSDGSILIWDSDAQMKSAEPGPTSLTSHLGTIVKIAVSADGRFVASGGNDGAVLVYDRDTGKTRDLMNLPQQSRKKINRVVFAPAGYGLAAAGRDGIVRLWDADSGDLIAQFDLLKGHRVGGLAFGPQGDFIAATDDLGRLALWNLREESTPQCIAISKQELYSVAVDPSRSLIAAGGADRVVYVWSKSAPTESPIALFGHQDKVNDVAFNGKGLLASASGDGTVIVWDVEQCANVRRLAAHSGGVWSVAFDSSGRWMVTGGEDRKIRIWDSETGDLIREFQERKRVCGTVFGPRAQFVVSGGSDRVVKLWEQPELLSTPR